MTYRQFKTGLTYRDVYQMLWVHSEDSREWRYKRRATVLGFWHELKLQLWERVQDEKETISERDTLGA